MHPACFKEGSRETTCKRSRFWICNRSNTQATGKMKLISYRFYALVIVTEPGLLNNATTSSKLEGKFLILLLTLKVFLKMNTYENE